MTSTTDQAISMGGCDTSCEGAQVIAFFVDGYFEIPYTREFLEGLSRLPKPPDLPCPEDDDL